MCIIIDASVFGRFLREPPSEDAIPIHNWLNGKGRIVYSTGGKFANEIGRKARERLLTYVRAGRAIEVKAERLHEEETALAEQIASDDPHVLALARVSGARLLYTNDANLMADFKNKRLIDDPRGSVYTRAANAHLFRRAVCAPSL